MTNGTIVAADQANMITCVIRFEKSDLIISGSSNSNILVLNITNGQLVNKLNGQTSTVMCLALLFSNGYI